jgi:hypothetical protein
VAFVDIILLKWIELICSFSCSEMKLDFVNCAEF